MFEFKGTAYSRDGDEPDWRVQDHYNIQQLGRRPFTTMAQPSLHQRARTEDAGRPSLPQYRSKSNTSIPRSAPHEMNSITPTTSLDRFTPRNSTDRRSYSSSTHTRGDSSGSFGKSLIAKGSRLLKRQNSKQDDLTSLQTLDWLEEYRGEPLRDRVPEMPLGAHPRHSRIQSADAVAPRRNISAPFNFQHLTHTTPHHVQNIQAVNPDDLVSEFSAIRASQAPRRELRGIKADNIPPRNAVRERAGSETSSRSNTGYANSPPPTPQYSQNKHLYGLNSIKLSTKSLRHAASLENFSQPSPGYYTAQTSPTSPMRFPSGDATTDFFDFQQGLPNEPDLNHGTAIEESEVQDDPVASWKYEAYDFETPHAVTTPDETAHTIRSMPFSMVRTELTEVPEEDETPEGKRSSVTTLAIRPSTPNSLLRHAKSFPSTASPHRRPITAHRSEQSDVDTMSQDVGTSLQCSDLFAEEHLDEVPSRPLAVRFTSAGPHGVDESWEDVIDYCYEHKAEADCNFDWDSASTHEETKLATSADSSYADGAVPASPKVHDEGVFVMPNHTPPTHRRSSSAYSSPPPVHLSLQTSLPELEPPSANSAQSSFSSIAEAVTPSQSFGSLLPTRSTGVNTQDLAGTKNTMSSPMLLSTDSARQSVQEDLYQQIITGDFAPEQNFLYNMGCADGSTIDNSPRSSHSPISKSNSQESFWSSHPGCTNRRHCNDGSIGSLPELVQSHPCRDRSTSMTDTLSTSDILMLPPPPPPLNFSTRMRSSSSTSSLKNPSPRVSRYSLFPPPNIRLT